MKIKGKIVSMCSFRDMIIFATEYGLYRLVYRGEIDGFILQKIEEIEGC